MDRYAVTHAQFVPTMFVRMLRLPQAVQDSARLTSLRAAVHAAAPCPIGVKRQMIDWWGPRIFEYYSSTEGAGATFIDSHEWLDHPGSVGKAIVGSVRILDDEGRELPSGAVGTIWFEGGPPFAYHNDPAKTAQAINDKGWATMGDVGFLDQEGYLYLTDRKSFTIISGGVNIYPQESENLLATHPKVMDVAVLGVPNEEFGEEVKAVVQPIDWRDAGPPLEEELIRFCRQHLAAYKCPRSIDFERDLPRLDTGKLYKQILRDRYWQAHESSAGRIWSPQPRN
jgi:fatty-acyl-CoA synthase